MDSIRTIHKRAEPTEGFGFDPRKETQTALSHMIDRLVWAVLALGGIGALASVNRVLQIGWHSDVVIDIAFFGLALLVLAIRRRIGVQWTAGVLVTTLGLYALGGLFSFGLISLAPVILITAVVFVGIFFGFRMSLLFLCLTLAAYVAVGWTHVKGWAPGVLSPLEYLRSTDGWAAKITGYTLFAVVVAIVIDSLRTQLFAVLNALSQRAKDLSASEQKYRMLADNIDDALMVAQSPSLETVYASPSALRMFGLTEEEVPHVRPETMMTEESCARAIADISHYMALAEHGPVVIPLREYEYIRRDGTKVWCELKPRFLYDEQGRVTGMLVVCRDINERKRAEREKAELQERLTHAEKMESIGHLAGGVAHDFNNLLTGIQGAADLLRRADLPEPKQKLVELILSSARHASYLTRNLLTFARKAPMEIKPLRVSRILEEVVLLLKSGLDKNILIEYRSDDDVSVMGDAAMLTNALINLGLNARDSIPETGTVRFEVFRRRFDDAKPCWGGQSLPPGAYVEIAVVDTGVGMSAEVIERIFTPFFTTKNQGGTGLGLAAVFGAVTAQHGGIEVESRPGRGSRFSILMPECAHPGEAGELEARRTTPPKRALDVLVVDDEESVRTVLTEMLKSLGHKVTSFEDGPSALKAIDDRPEAFDLAIVDLSMPRMSGREVLNQIRSRRPELFVLLSSGHPLEKDLEAARAQKAVGFLSKPYTLDALAAALPKISRDLVE